MSEQENTAIVQQGYNNFKTGNIEALLDQLSADVTWQLPEIKGVPLAGRRTGRDGVADFFATVARDQEVIEFEPREFVAQGDRAEPPGRYTGRVREVTR